MRRTSGITLLAVVVVASACSGGGRETPVISIPEQVVGQVTVPEGIAPSVCRLAVGTGLGAEVVSVDADIPASFVLQEGDVITEVDGVGVTESGDLIDVLRSREIGDSVSVRVVRRGSGPIQADVELIEHVDGSGDPMLGIGMRTAVDLHNVESVESTGALVSPLTAVLSVDGSLFAVDAVEGVWMNLESATPTDAWTPVAGSIYVLENGEPDRVVDIAAPDTAVVFDGSGWDGRWLLGSQAGLVLVYADRNEDLGLEGAIFAVDPGSGSVEWVWAPQDSERTDFPIPIFAVSSPSQERTLVGTAQFDDQGNAEVLRFSLLDRAGEPVLVVPPVNGELPNGLIAIGWHTNTEIAYHDPANGNIVLWNVDTGDISRLELPGINPGVQMVPVGDGTHFIMTGTGVLDLVRTGESASTRPLAVDCVADQIAPPGFVGA